MNESEEQLPAAGSREHPPAEKDRPEDQVPSADAPHVSEEDMAISADEMARGRASHHFSDHVDEHSQESASRRGFFAKLMRDAVGPLAAILENRFTPVTDALQGKSQFLRESEFPHEPDEPEHSAPQPRTILRPPGALLPGDFESTCSRCAKCVEVCPVKAIQIDKAGMVAGGFPYIMPGISPCVVCDDLSCMKSCPTSALILVEREHIRIGVAEVDHAQCLRSSGEDCRLCLEACPFGERAIIVSATSGKVLVKMDGCVGCGMCEQACPTEPAAIVVNPRPQLEDPIIA